MKYRKKPIVIEAFQRLSEDVPGFVTRWYGSSHSLIIHTLEGDMIANEADWIITGINGEQYLCKPDIFEKTYEKVKE